MPDPVIEVAAKSEQNDIFMVRWKYGDFHNVTIYPETLPGNAKYYLNEPLRWRARERWPVEGGSVRRPEYFSQVLRQYGSYVDMVEVCFPHSGSMTEDGLGHQFQSYVATMSEDLPDTVFIGYMGRDGEGLPKVLTDALRDHPQRLIKDRNTLDRLGEVVTNHYGPLSSGPVRFKNGKPMGHGPDAQRFQPYHKRAAEARRGGAGAGTSSMPRSAPEASGARAGRSGAGLEGMGEGVDKGLPDLGPYAGPGVPLRNRLNMSGVFPWGSRAWRPFAGNRILLAKYSLQKYSLAKHQP